MGFFNFFSKKEKKETLDTGLQNTKASVFSKLTHAVAGKSKVDEDVLDNLEDVLITSDVGVDTTLDIIHKNWGYLQRESIKDTSFDAGKASKIFIYRLCEKGLKFIEKYEAALAEAGKK